MIKNCMKSTLFASIISDTTNCTYIFSVDIFVYPTATAFCFPSAITACVTFKDLNDLSRNSKSVFTAHERSCGKVPNFHKRRSFCWGGGWGLRTSHVSWDRSHGRVTPSTWTSELGTYPHYWFFIWWSSLETCSNLFTWGSTPPNWYWHLVVATETCTVGKRAVPILLGCCLVII